MKESNFTEKGILLIRRHYGIARKLVQSVIENAEKCNVKLVADCSYAKKAIENR